MNENARDWLLRLGAGESIQSICDRAKITRDEFDSWWRREATQRASRPEGTTTANVGAAVSIDRDPWGIPHIRGSSNQDVWFGFGFAMAQDRLFQMDYLRRKGWGTLAEVLGPDGVPFDLIARTVGLHRIARAEEERLPELTRALLVAFSAGVNAWIDETADLLPIEFDLLGYRPERWTPADCLVIEGEFRWYLTGRLPVIVMPELAKRELGDGELYREFLRGEADEESIVPRESYAARVRAGQRRELESGPAEPTGSNNWVVAGGHTQSGRPMVASDPHIAIEAVSCWYEAHLAGGDFDVMGMAYVGMPAIMAGRTRNVAWGITNNICSQRDLYQERMDANHPGCFLFDEQWEPARELTEVISVKGREPLTRTIRLSRNGPLVDELLPPAARDTGPVTLRWLGAEQGGWLTSLLDINRAQSVNEFRAALEPWHVPTFNLVVADTAGQIAVQCAGRIPQRDSAERGYRPGWDPEHQWTGLIPFDELPHAIDPPRGWLASANNRLVDEDYPFPVFGTWSSGYRAQRIRQMMEANLELERQTGEPVFDRQAFRAMQYDTVSLRAVNCLPAVRQSLEAFDDPRVPAVLAHVRAWDGNVTANSVAAAVFNVFFTCWTDVVVQQRFQGPTAELLAKQAEGMASRLLAEDPLSWFAPDQRAAAFEHAWRRTFSVLDERCGPDIASWTWSQIHQLPLRHWLGNRGDLGVLLDQRGSAVDGDMVTVCNTGSGPDWSALTGAGYRLIVDLAEDGLWALDGQSQSGLPGTAHYADQLAPWLNGQYHFMPFAREETAQPSRWQLMPRARV